MSAWGRQSKLRVRGKAISGQANREAMKKKASGSIGTAAGAKAEQGKQQAKKEVKKTMPPQKQPRPGAQKEVKKNTKKDTKKTSKTSVTKTKDVKKDQRHPAQPKLHSSTWVYARQEFKLYDGHTFVNPNTLEMVYFDYDGEPQRGGSNFLFVDEAVYVTGGNTLEHSTGVVDSAHKYLVNVPSRDKVILKHMISPRAYHETTSLNQWIYAVAGAIEHLSLKCCEKYSIASNIWVRVPSINNTASKYTLCVYKQQFIYKFACNEEIETLDTYDEDSGWRLLRLAHPWPKSDTIAQCVQMASNRLLIMGNVGMLRTTTEKGSFMHVYNVQKRTIAHTQPIFRCCELGPLYLQRGRICSLHSYGNELYQLDLKHLVWNITPLSPP